MSQNNLHSVCNGKTNFTELAYWLVVVDGKHKKELVLSWTDCLRTLSVKQFNDPLEMGEEVFLLAISTFVLSWRFVMLKRML